MQNVSEYGTFLCVKTNEILRQKKVCLFSKDKIMLMSISKTERVCLNKVQQQRSFAFSLFFLQQPILKEAGFDKIQKQKFVCKKNSHKKPTIRQKIKKIENAVNTLQLRQH